MITKLNFSDRTIKSYAIRKLTPKECFRLMGVREDVISAMQSTVAEVKEYVDGIKGKEDDMAVSASQQYKMAGNSIVVDVLIGTIGNIFYPPQDTYIKTAEGETYKVGDNGQLLLF